MDHGDASDPFRHGSIRLDADLEALSWIASVPIP
jgi:hypothetical protein